MNRIIEVEAVREGMAKLRRDNETLHDALELVLLFYTINWTAEKRARWAQITGVDEATTKVMCDHIRKVIGQ